MSRFMYAIDGDSPEDGWELDSAWDGENPVSMAEEAAADYHSNHDGWEASWPVEITLYRMDGSEIGRYKVEREAEPVFYAKPTADKPSSRKERP